MSPALSVEEDLLGPKLNEPEPGDEDGEDGESGGEEEGAGEHMGVEEDAYLTQAGVKEAAVREAVRAEQDQIVRDTMYAMKQRQQPLDEIRCPAEEDWDEDDEDWDDDDEDWED